MNNQTSFADWEPLGLNVPTLFQLPSDTSSTAGFIAYSAIFALAVSLLYGSVLYPKFSNLGKYWNTESWLVNASDWFPRLKGQLRSIKQSRQMFDEGYAKFSKKGKAFLMPVMGNEPFLVLPPTELRELLGKPDRELDEELPHAEATQKRYTIRNRRIEQDNFHFDVVRRELTRKLPLLTPDVFDELCRGMRQQWSDSDKDWNTVKVYPTAMRIVSRAANRVFGGTKLCRIEEFLEHSKLYSQGIFGGAAMINLFPKWVRPVVAPIITYPNRHNYNVCARIAEPIIRERLDNTYRKLRDPEHDWEAPTDALQWLIELVLERGDAAELVPEQITGRLLQLNMVAIHTTSMVMANVILDLFAAEDNQEIVAGLREECSRVLKAHGGQWTKQAINDLVRVDSAIRETMRFSDLGTLGLQRMVVAEGGVDFHGGAIHVPKGVRVAMPTYSMHHDDAFYPNARSYDPFRFSRPREAYEAAGAEARDAQRTLDLKNQSLITVGDSFLSFGNGRHACPGRFFAAQEMKLMLAEIVMSYDIEIVGGKRVPNVSMVSSSIPDSNAEMRVKRRAQ